VVAPFYWVAPKGKKAQEGYSIAQKFASDEKLQETAVLLRVLFSVKL
jgi:hypothetical protein